MSAKFSENDAFTDLLLKARHFCAYAERCTYEVTQRVKKWTPDSHLYEDKLIEELKESGFLDEKRFIESYLRGHVLQKAWGMKKVKAHLAQKQIDASEIDAVFEQSIPISKYKAVLLATAEKKWRLLKQKEADSTKRQQKLIYFLQSRGFEWRYIEAILEDLGE